MNRPVAGIILFGILWVSPLAYLLAGPAYGQVSGSENFSLEEIVPVAASGEMQSELYVTSVVAGGSLPLAEATSESFSIESGVMAARFPLPIDVIPGTTKNPINTKKLGVIPVTMLSSMTFDARLDILQESLTFGRSGDEKSLSHCSQKLEDINNDGLPDLVCFFNAPLTAFDQSVPTNCAPRLIPKPIKPTPTRRSKSRPFGKRRFGVRRRMPSSTSPPSSKRSVSRVNGGIVSSTISETTYIPPQIPAAVSP